MPIKTVNLDPTPKALTDRQPHGYRLYIKNISSSRVYITSDPTSPKENAIILDSSDPPYINEKAYSIYYAFADVYGVPIAVETS